MSGALTVIPARPSGSPEGSATITLTTDTVHAVTAHHLDLARRIDHLIATVGPVISF